MVAQWALGNRQSRHIIANISVRLISSVSAEYEFKCFLYGVMYYYVSTGLNVSRLVLQLSLPNSLNPGVKWRVKVLLEQRRQAVLQLHLSDQPFNA